MLNHPMIPWAQVKGKIFFLTYLRNTKIDKLTHSYDSIMAEEIVMQLFAFSLSVTSML